MITSILYQVWFDTDSDAIMSCKPVGVITDNTCDIKCCKRVLDEFIVYVQSANGEEDAKDKAMKLIESWVS
jgi:hypothetical protein